MAMAIKAMAFGTTNSYTRLLVSHLPLLMKSHCICEGVYQPALGSVPNRVGVVFIVKQWEHNLLTNTVIRDKQLKLKYGVVRLFLPLHDMLRGIRHSHKLSSSPPLWTHLRLYRMRQSTRQMHGMSGAPYDKM